MLVTHFHFGGRCDEAISFYENAFNTKADFIDRNETGGVLHAEMHILGQRVMMNDYYGSKGNNTEDFAIQIVPIFKSKEQLLDCYEKLKDEAIYASTPTQVFYSPLVADITDKFGIRWGLMVDENLDE